ncbi:restriction endonuclease subunit S [Candidatus Nomurabacteria bacterium]|nr:restriction endonuclease subunit S [Candidatus Nomurabacteria bacterium]
MNWETVEIGQLGEVITGNTPPRKNPELYGDYIPFIKPTDMEIDRRYTPNPEECYSELGYDKYRKSLIPKGATCIVTIGSIGKKMTQAMTDCFINQAVNAVIPNHEYDNDYVYYLLKNNLDKVKGLDSGTSSGRENVSKSSFSSIEVKVLKHLPTQRKIASILSAYDNLIENNLKRIKLLELSANISYAKFKPVEKLALQSKAEYLGRGVTPKYEEGSRFYAINQKANKGSMLDYSQFKSLDSKLEVPIEKYAKRGDLLINSLGEGTLGRVHFYTGKSDEFAVDQHMSIFRTSEIHYTFYLYQFLSSSYGQGLLDSLKKGGTNMTMLNISDLRQLEILFPNELYLKELWSICEPIFRLKQTLINQNILLGEARDILLPRLMNGDIEV